MIETQTILLNGLNINEIILGDGQPVVMLHGWGANLKLVQPLAEQLARQGFRAYVLDLPGFGTSDEPPQAWTVSDYAQFVLDYLDYHQLERVYLFGHSFGGRLGLILGADHSQRLIKMVLSDAAGIHTKAPFLASLRLTTYKTIRDGLYRMGLKSLADPLRAAYNKRYGSTDFLQVSGIMRETFVKVINEDLLPYAARVKVSTLLFWGDKDEATPLWQGQLLEKTIPDAGLIVHQGAGHYAYLDKLSDTARVMIHFFRQNS